MCDNHSFCQKELAHLGSLSCNSRSCSNVANQIIPQCKLHASALMLMSRTSKTLIADRGPPTFGDGIFPQQVISSVAHIPFMMVFPAQASRLAHSDTNLMIRYEEYSFKPTFWRTFVGEYCSMCNEMIFYRGLGHAVYQSIHLT